DLSDPRRLRRAGAGADRLLLARQRRAAAAARGRRRLDLGRRLRLHARTAGPLGPPPVRARHASPGAACLPAALHRPRRGGLRPGPRLSTLALRDDRPRLDRARAQALARGVGPGLRTAPALRAPRSGPLEILGFPEIS